MAIENADRSFGEFFVADLCGFQPPKHIALDVVVFNEVLYYIDVDLVPFQLRRYSQYLSSAGVIIISMKDDPKSQAILRVIMREFDWVTGALMQEKTDCEYEMRRSRERPAYLIGVLRIRTRMN